MQVYTTKEKKGKLAITEYEVLKSNNQFSLVQIHILTGRKNQIRVAMQSIGCSIVGDKKYGAPKNPIRRLCLHANALEIIHPITKKKYVFEAKCPDIFKKLVES